MNQDAVVQALQRLNEWGGFETFQSPGERFLQVERNYKVEASAQIRALFAAAELQDAIDRRDLTLLKSRLSKFNAEKGFTNLLNWRDFVEVFTPFERQTEDEQRFFEFFQALVDLQADEPDLVAALDRLAHALSGGNQALMGGNMWVCASYLAFMLRPERFMFVKPMVTNAFFKRFGFEWQRPRYFAGAAYAQLMGYIRALCDLLSGMGTPPNDMIDVQSMLWILEGFPPDEAPKETVVALMIEAVGALAAGGRKGATAADIERYLKEHHADKAWNENTIIPADYALWAGYGIPCDASSARGPFHFERVNAKKPYEYRLISEAPLEPPDLATAQAASAIHEAIPAWSRRLLSQPEQYRQELNNGINFVSTVDLSSWTYGKSVGADGNYHEDGIGARHRLEKLGFIDVMSLGSNAPLRAAVVEAFRQWAAQCGNPSVLARLENETSPPRLFVPPLWLATQPAQPGPRYWWVSLGRSFTATKDRGFLWAPKESATGRSLQHNLNILEFQPGDIVFYNVDAVVRGVAKVLETAVDASGPLEASGIETPVEGYSVQVAYQDLTVALPVDEIPLAWRTLEAGPFDLGGETKKGYILPVASTFAHQLFDRFPGRWPMFEGNSGGHQIWMFQSNPKYFSPQAPDAFYDMETRTVQMQAGDEDWWKVTRYREEMRAGDTVLIWQSGQKAGVYAVGEIVSPPEAQEGAGWSVQFRYTQIPLQPLLKPAVLAHPALRNLQILRQPQGTNFKVTPAEWEAIQTLMAGTQKETFVSYAAPSFEQVVEGVLGQGLRLDLPVIRRYHLALKTRGFVILSGISGAGKTWLTEAYAKAVGAEHRLVAVAPNWNTNEDLLGYFNPLDQLYHDTAFSRFLRDASTEYQRAQQAGRAPRPFHLVLDEMNLARVEHYFAKFLSAMEVRARYGTAPLELAPGEVVQVPPNLVFVGTVNVDETTHGFADKVYDRAQLLELSPSRENVEAHLEGAAYRVPLLEVWDAVYPVAPFAFRVLDEIRHYVEAASELGVPWEEALDEQVLYKILPKVKGTNPHVGRALEQVVAVTPSFPLCHGRARQMLEGYKRHGFASFF